jgi:hypothetical protein
MTQPGAGDLNLDTAQFEDGTGKPVSCGFCQQPITDYYYHIGGQAACQRCQVKLAREFTRSPRFWRAAALGLLAAAVGSALWYAVGRLTGYEIGLIAIVVGLLVGGAVKVGAGGVGGVSVQLLAMVLTYTSIVSSYAPMMLAEFRKATETQNRRGGISPTADPLVPASNAVAGGDAEARAFLAAFGQALAAWSGDSGVGGREESVLDSTYGALRALLAINATPRFDFADSTVTYAGAPLSELGAWPWGTQMVQAGYSSLNFQPSVTRLDLLRLLDAVDQTAVQAAEVPGPLQVALAFAVLIAFLYLAPILAGFENIIGMLIIGFALYEAWKINKRVKVEITGPFQVRPATR